MVRMPLFFLMLTVLFVACKNDPPVNTQAQRIANAFCECSTQLVQMNQKAERMRADTLPLNLEELSLEYEKVKDCAGTIIGQNGGKLKPDLMAQVQKNLLEKCPDVAKQSDLIREMLAE
jgi:hypothetical protein